MQPFFEPCLWGKMATGSHASVLLSTVRPLSFYLNRDIMGSLSHIRPLFGNTPATVTRPLAEFVASKKKTDVPIKKTSASDEEWRTKDYFLYGAAGIGALGAAYTGHATFGPAIGRLFANLLGNKPPPLPPPPPLSPAMQL